MSRRICLALDLVERCSAHSGICVHASTLVAQVWKPWKIASARALFMIVEATDDYSRRDKSRRLDRLAHSQVASVILDLDCATYTEQTINLYATRIPQDFCTELRLKGLISPDAPVPTAGDGP